MSRVREIDISQLRTGMFISEMDLSWIDNPFMRNRRAIKSEADIKLLRKAGARRLVIDLDKGVDIEEARAGETPEASEKPVTESAGPDAASPRRTAQPARTRKGAPAADSAPTNSVAAEMKAAHAAIERTCAALGEDFKEWEQGRVGVSDELREALGETRASLGRNNQAMLSLLADAQKEPSLISHTFACFTLITSLLANSRFSDDDCDAIGICALFHDIGWLRLPRNLLIASRAYTEKEKALTARHVALSVQLVSQTDHISERILTWIGQHSASHAAASTMNDIESTEPPRAADSESLSTRAQMGQPSLASALSDTDIQLLEAFRVVNHYDEVCAGIAGNPPRLPSAALGLLYKAAQAGQFSPYWVQQLIQLVGLYPLGSAVELSNKERGRIIEIRRTDPLLPIVAVYYNRIGQPLLKPEIRDLLSLQAQSVRISRAIDPSDPKMDPAGILKNAPETD